jgi:hypothetical protein
MNISNPKVAKFIDSQLGIHLGRLPKLIFQKMNIAK